MSNVHVEKSVNRDVEEDEFSQKEKAMILEIGDKFSHGHDMVKTIERLCEEIWINRRLNLELEHQLTRLERQLHPSEPPSR